MSKNALLVGINAYNGYPLQGCLNDVLAMEHFLEGLGFTCKSLTDAQATCASIRSGLEALISNAKTGDTILFHYSGHGAQVPDHANLPSRKADGLTEVLCPVDFNFYNGTYITDHELHSLFSLLPEGVVAEVILDCCHSGTALRDVEIQSKTIAVPNDVNEKRVLSKDLVLLDANAQNNVVLWSACKANETAADAYIANTYHGAFTYCFIVTNQQQGLLRTQIEEGVCKLMVQNGWQQTPQLECTLAEENSTFLGASARDLTPETIEPTKISEDTETQEVAKLSEDTKEIVEDVKEIVEEAEQIAEKVEHVISVVSDAASILSHVFGRPVPMNKTGQAESIKGLKTNYAKPNTLGR